MEEFWHDCQVIWETSSKLLRDIDLSHQILSRIIFQVLLKEKQLISISGLSKQAHKEDFSIHKVDLKKDMTYLQQVALAF